MTNAPEDSADDAKPKTKAERLEAKAARLREAELARAERAKAAQLAGGGATPSGAVRPWQIASGVLALVLVAVLSVGIPYTLSQRSKVDHNASLNAARTQVLKTAKQAAIDFGSYDYRHLSADFAKVLKELTPAFRANYGQVATKLQGAIQQYKGIAKASVLEMGVSSLSTKAAVVIVLMDQSVTTTQSTAARIDRNRLEMTLAKQKNGTWLVSNLLLK